MLRYKANLNLRNKKGLTPLEVAASEEILNILTKAKRFQVIERMSENKPSKSLKDAERKLFRAADEDTD